MATTELTLKSLDGRGRSRTGAPAAATSACSSRSRRPSSSCSIPPHEVLVVSGIGCSSNLPGLHPRLRRPQPARPGAARRHRGHAGQPRPARDRGRRRRRRLRHRHGPLHPRHAAQPQPHLHRDGQRDLRPDHRPGLADDDRGAQDEEHAPRQRGEARSSRSRWPSPPGATYVARGFSGEPKQLTRLVAGAIAHRGFSLIDVFSPCVTFNKVNTYPWFKERVYKLEDEKGYDTSNLMAAMQKSMEFDGRHPDRAPLQRRAGRPTRTASPCSQRVPWSISRWASIAGRSTRSWPRRCSRAGAR